MRVVCISDTHNHVIRDMPEGDLLIHAGDLTGLGTIPEIKAQLDWLSTLSDLYQDIVFVAGNHDFLFEKQPQMARMLVSEYPALTYLEDEYKIIQGKKVWGSPVTPRFYNWAFNRDENIENHWSYIPEDTDILITHGPPKYTLDLAGDNNAGCIKLTAVVNQVSPPLHVFGHIHFSYGVKSYPNGRRGQRYAVNAAVTDHRNRLTRRPIEIEI
jgi:Icc-related predicted phosphoesterase